MDADAMLTRLTAVEHFLDSVEPRWRDHAEIHRQRRDRTSFADRAQRPADDLIIDEEQTKRDRIALGYDAPEPEAAAPKSGEDPNAPEPQGKTVEQLTDEDLARAKAHPDGATGGAPAQQAGASAANAGTAQAQPPV